METQNKLVSSLPEPLARVVELLHILDDVERREYIRRLKAFPNSEMTSDDWWETIYKEIPRFKRKELTDLWNATFDVLYRIREKENEAVRNALKGL